MIRFQKFWLLQKEIFEWTQGRLKQIFDQTLQKLKMHPFASTFFNSFVSTLDIYFCIKYETGLKFNNLTLELFIIKIGMLMQWPQFVMGSRCVWTDSQIDCRDRKVLPRKLNEKELKERRKKKQTIFFFLLRTAPTISTKFVAIHLCCLPEVFVKLWIICSNRIGYVIQSNEYLYDFLIYYSLSNAFFRCDDERFQSSSSRYIFQNQAPIGSLANWRKCLIYLNIFGTCIIIICQYVFSETDFTTFLKTFEWMMFIIKIARHTSHVTPHNSLHIQNKTYETGKHFCQPYYWHLFPN